MFDIEFADRMNFFKYILGVALCKQSVLSTKKCINLRNGRITERMLVQCLEDNFLEINMLWIINCNLDISQDKENILMLIRKISFI